MKTSQTSKIYRFHQTGSPDGIGLATALEASTAVHKSNRRKNLRALENAWCFCRKSVARLVPELLLVLALEGSLSACGPSFHVGIKTDPRRVSLLSGVGQRPQWLSKPVKVVLGPSLRGDIRKYATTYDEIYLAENIVPHGFRHLYRREGVGTPLVLIKRNPHSNELEKHYPTPDIVMGLTGILDESCRPMRLKLVDPFDRSIAMSKEPIASDYTAALAVLDSRGTGLQHSAVGALIRPDKPRYGTGVYLIHPFQSDKIPILFVHGLLSTPITWANLLNELTADPEIVAHYQPWFFLYPTGQPLLVSARELRDDLERVCRLVDPSGKNPLLRQMVIVGHSMGGLLSHTLVSDSGDLIWSALSTKPFDQLRLSAPDRAELKEMMFFKPNSHIKCVVFMAVPHRGSGLAKGFVGAIGSRLMHPPKDTFDLVKRVAAENPGIWSDQFNRMIHSGGPTSIFSLGPNPVLDNLAALPIGVPYHSVIGDQGRGNTPQSSDGVVPYRSSHLPGALSEDVVPASHTAVVDHPASVEALKRILHEHLRRVGLTRLSAGREDLSTPGNQ